MTTNPRRVNRNEWDFGTFDDSQLPYPLTLAFHRVPRKGSYLQIKNHKQSVYNQLTAQAGIPNPAPNPPPVHNAAGNPPAANNAAANPPAANNAAANPPNNAQDAVNQPEQKENTNNAIARNSQANSQEVGAAANQPNGSIRGNNGQSSNQNGPYFQHQNQDWIPLWVRSHHDGMLEFLYMVEASNGRRYPVYGNRAQFYAGLNAENDGQ